MYDEIPFISQPTANMKSWSGNEIDPVGNLDRRKIYMQVGSADTVRMDSIRAPAFLKSMLIRFNYSDGRSQCNGAAGVATLEFRFRGEHYLHHCPWSNSYLPHRF